MKHIFGGLDNKSEDHIERAHQDVKYSERMYCGLTNFNQSQVTHWRKNYMMSNPQVKLKSEQIKVESKINLKRKM